MSEYRVRLELGVVEWQNLTLLATSLGKVLRKGRADFPPELLSPIEGSREAEERFARELILLKNLLARAVDDACDLPGESPRDLDRMCAAFSMEEASALSWCVNLMIRLLTDDNPTLPTEAFDEEIHDRILGVLASAITKIPTRNQPVLISLTEDVVIISTPQSRRA